MEAEGVVPNGQVKPIIGLVDLFRLHEEGPGVTSRYNNVKLRAGKPVPHRVVRRALPHLISGGSKLPGYTLAGSKGR